MKTATRARDKGTVRLLTAEIDPRLDDAINVLMDRTKHLKRVVVTFALQEYLAKHGLWPPAGEPEE